MCVKVWQTARAGLFLLFIVVLAALGPANAAVASSVPAPAMHEYKPDPKEQRDGEKLRDRLPKPAALNRRHQDRHSGDRRPLPVFLQAPTNLPELRRTELPDFGSGGYHEHMRLRHSPMTLQVFRH